MELQEVWVLLYYSQQLLVIHFRLNSDPLEKESLAQEKSDILMQLQELLKFEMSKDA